MCAFNQRLDLRRFEIGGSIRGVVVGHRRLENQANINSIFADKFLILLYYLNSELYQRK